MNKMDKFNRKSINAGIIDIQVYFPNYFIDQAELEEHDKVGKGKYTKGLGQLKMAVTTDREDINSISLTVLDKLLTKNKLNKKDVGRLEVGTETFNDKSKSTKTYLMSFFQDANTDIEGVTTSNACYGGTNALLNTVNWIQSEFYDGRYGIVIIADIAVYGKGNARPTGGCGAMAILLGPNAHIVLEPVRSTYMNHVYDFFKPDPTKEYPVVDGAFSLNCYMKSLEACYLGYIEKLEKSQDEEVKDLNRFDYYCFHSPFAKMVEKAFVNLVGYEIMRTDNYKSSSTETNQNKFKLSDDSSLTKQILSKKGFLIDTEVHNSLKQVLSDNKLIQNQLEPSLSINRLVGNSYTSSLYLGLLSLIINKDIDLSNKRILMFSYGSGCAATLFSLKVHSEYKEIKLKNTEIMDSLNSRIKITPKELEDIMTEKEKLYLSKNFKTKYDLSGLVEGTYYLSEVDNNWKRHYCKKISKEFHHGEISFNKLSWNSLRRFSLVRDQLINTKIKKN